ncbi:hypothetical protein N866_04830 [Actinotalea ferrariae CF5-4]|uniref:Uncharacterized protein n=1 Tax=Actinotalea ferrariae CF5-4 TaxID=948458 RepID=A0A021VS35_9CELL|nr:hypothetical protein N866_04830 [Actinotalea ferrariae CF5-4]
MGRPPQGAVADPEGQALEAVLGLEEALVGRDGDVERGGDGRSRLLRAQQRRGDDVHDVVAGRARRTGAAEVVGHPARHRLTALGQAEAVEPAVEDAAGVVHLAVAQQVDGGRGHRGHVPSIAHPRSDHGRL